MNQVTWYSIAFVCIFGCVAFANTNQFVKEKRTKKVSVARLKEETGQLLGDCLMHSTSIIEQMGKLQRELMHMTAALIEQRAESKLTSADRIALDKTLDELMLIECDLSALSKRLSAHTDVVKKQY